MRVGFDADRFSTKRAPPLTNTEDGETIATRIWGLLGPFKGFNQTV